MRSAWRPTDSETAVSYARRSACSRRPSAARTNAFSEDIARRREETVSTGGRATTTVPSVAVLVAECERTAEHPS